MFNSSRIAGHASGALTVAMVAAIGTPSAPATIPPVRTLGPVVTRAKMPVGVIEQLIELPDGRVVINDGRRFTLAILDASLEKGTVILGRGVKTDAATRGRRYPAGGGTALRYRGDSIVFANPRGRSFLVVDGAGRIVREAPFPAGPSPLAGSNAPAGMHGDREGHVVYSAMTALRCGPNVSAFDSMPLLRTDMRTLGVDTVSFARRAVRECQTNHAVEDRSPATRLLNRLRNTVPVLQAATQRDEWALLSDGTVAVVRADYSIDWQPLHGKSHTTPRIAVAPHHLTDADKQAIADSLKVYYSHLTDSIYKNVVLLDNQYKRMVDRERAKVTPERLMPHMPTAHDIPDELRAFQGPIRVDAADNLWIPESTNAFTPRERGRLPGNVYDVVNRNGVLVDRVRIPDSSTLLGFGRAVAYVSSREGKGRTLTRVKIR